MSHYVGRERKKNHSRCLSENVSPKENKMTILGCKKKKKYILKMSNYTQCKYLEMIIFFQTSITKNAGGISFH